MVKYLWRGKMKRKHSVKKQRNRTNPIVELLRHLISIAGLALIHHKTLYAS